VAEPNNAILGQVAANHAGGQPRLERLVNHARSVREVSFQLANEFAQRDRFHRASPEPVKHVDLGGASARIRGYPLDTPDAAAAVPAVLLEDTRATVECCRQVLE